LEELESDMKIEKDFKLKFGMCNNEIKTEIKKFVLKKILIILIIFLSILFSKILNL